jgi:probable rRNA maturation factor
MKMHKVEILIKDNKWKKEISDIENLFSIYFNTIFNTFKKFKKKKLEISILLTNSKEMKDLNKKFRKKNKDTDVLSFPNYQKSFFTKKIIPNYIFLGDLALSYNYIKKTKLNFIKYIEKVFVHGCLHLVGYKHDNMKEYNIMSKLEKKILSQIS